MLKVKKFTFNPFSENTYVMYDDSKECVIIDPGCFNHEEQDQLSNFIANNNLTPTMLWHTHSHLDHVFGSSYVAKKYNLKVIEDAAEALGSKYKGKRVGSIGDCGVFSFHGTKTASSGEGGMFITDDEDLYEEFTILHNQGRVKEEKKFFYPHKIGLK